VHRQKAHFWLPAHGLAYEGAPRRKAIGTAKSQRTELSPREQVAASRRVVVKIGTNVLMRDDGGVSIGAFYGIAESLANFRRAGREVLLVSSGAVGLGVQRLELSARPSELALVQACAAVGQSRLMSMYDDAFEKLGFRVAQVLLTEDDFLDARRHENLRATLSTLLQLGVIPVINENDTVSTAELDSPAGGAERVRVFGDNDKLSALVMTHIDADLLVLLSDVDGLYTDDPQSESATLISELDSLDENIRGYARGGNGRGRGGMETKLEAVRIANEDGRPAIIANGRTPGVLDSILAGKPIGTLFFPRKSR
jgi:glutamate 5-kinase